MNIRELLFEALCNSIEKKINDSDNKYREYDPFITIWQYEKEEGRLANLSEFSETNEEYVEADKCYYEVLNDIKEKYSYNENKVEYVLKFAFAYYLDNEENITLKDYSDPQIKENILDNFFFNDALSYKKANECYEKILNSFIGENNYDYTIEALKIIETLQEYFLHRYNQCNDCLEEYKRLKNNKTKEDVINYLFKNESDGTIVYATQQYSNVLKRVNNNLGIEEKTTHPIADTLSMIGLIDWMSRK